MIPDLKNIDFFLDILYNEVAELHIFGTILLKKRG